MENKFFEENSKNDEHERKEILYYENGKKNMKDILKIINVKVKEQNIMKMEIKNMKVILK